MSDPSIALRRAVVAALAVAPSVSMLVGARIYDAVPARVPPPRPYIVLGTFEVYDDTAECVDALEVIFQVIAWSDAVGSVEASSILSAVRGALHEVELDLSPDHALTEIRHRTSTVERAPDGLTTQGVITFRALTETL